MFVDTRGGRIHTLYYFRNRHLSLSEWKPERPATQGWGASVNTRVDTNAKDPENEKSSSSSEFVHDVSGGIDKNWNAEALRDENRNTVEEFPKFYEESDIIDPEEEEDITWTSPVGVERGEQGVFDLAELITVLEAENAREICTIQLPPEIQIL
ncbi:hypothetical protein ScPMuIL_016870 [Solemya velum]